MLQFGRGYALYWLQLLQSRRSDLAAIDGVSQSVQLWLASNRPAILFLSSQEFLVELISKLKVRWAFGSLAIEKPRFSNWRHILHTKFDCPVEQRLCGHL